MEQNDRGQTTIHASPSETPKKQRIWRGLALAAVILLAFVMSWMPDTPHTVLPSAEARAAAPQPPPPQFAALTQRTTDKPQAFVFEDGRMEIVKVRSKEEIPAEDRAGAVEIAPGQFGGISHVTAAGVFIFTSDIDVHVGDLDHFDKWTARFEAVGGDLKKVTSDLTVEPARGPPQTRKVYVIGRITEFHAPDLHDHASSNSYLLDLAPRAQRREEYCRSQAAVARHDDETEEQEHAAKPVGPKRVQSPAKAIRRR